MRRPQQKDRTKESVATKVYDTYESELMLGIKRRRVVTQERIIFLTIKTKDYE
jgi:hypothetical protein